MSYLLIDGHGSTQQITGAAGNVATDGAGNKLTETLPDGEVTTYTYDDLNRLISMTEKQGTTTLFSESFTLNDDGTRAAATESQLQTDSTTSTLNFSWGYDPDGRLNSEGLSATGDAAEDDYTDSYTFDLNGNQITDIHTGAGGTVGTTTNSYNGDDQLTDAVVTGGATTHYDYDLNGSQIDIKVNGTITTTNTYNVRNKMVGYSGSGGVSAIYVYNDDGNRVQETSGGVTTFYLTDTQNPTGYAQPIEEHHGTITSSPFRTYLIGDHAFGQVAAAGVVSYLLIDGHGSTQQITSSTGAVTAALAYTAYGTALHFDPAALGGAYFFGGDAVYDPISGLYMHGDGTRDRIGVRFIQADTEGNGGDGDPISLHKYLYAGGNPVMYNDPSGHDFDLETLELTVGEGTALDSTGLPAVSTGARSAFSAIKLIRYASLALSTALLTQLEGDNGPGGDVDPYDPPPPPGDIPLYKAPAKADLINGVSVPRNPLAEVTYGFDPVRYTSPFSANGGGVYFSTAYAGADYYRSLSAYHNGIQIIYLEGGEFSQLLLTHVLVIDSSPGFGTGVKSGGVYVPTSQIPTFNGYVRLHAAQNRYIPESALPPN